MHKRISIFAVSALIGSTLVSFGFGPARADETASPADFVANVRQQIAFLEQSSRLALAHTSDDKLRAFAQVEATEQQGVANDLRSWEAGQPTGGLTSPLVVASASIADPISTSAPVVTGRSAAVDRDESAGVLMASPGVVVMPQLSTLQGDSFDDLYGSTQTASLQALEGLYEAYSMTGKDPALRALALRELPLVKQRLAELASL